MRAWAMYDWANSAFVTTIGSVIMPIYYSDVAAANLPVHERTAYWGYTGAIGLLVVALIAPFLGIISDYIGAKRKFLAAFLVLGCMSSAGLYFVHKGDWLLASLLFIGGNIGFAAGNVFYDSLLPFVAKEEELDRVSAAGFALGYLGGGILLVINFAWILFPQTFGMADAGVASRMSFLSVAIWWLLFSIPLFRRVSEPPVVAERLPGNLVRISFGKLWSTFRQIMNLRNTFLFLVAFWLYNDGINTIIKMATIYGREIGIGQSQLIGAMALVQFLGVPFTFLFGPLAGRLGAKKGVILCLGIYCLISVLGFFMTSAFHFWILAGIVAIAQGGSQALSRSLYARMVPKSQSGEFFAFFTVSAKFAGVLGPLMFGLTAQMMGGSRYSILFLIAFFVIGIILLSFVDPDQGQAEALAIDAAAVR
jgi:UMF1 family MFS transporter